VSFFLKISLEISGERAIITIEAALFIWFVWAGIGAVYQCRFSFFLDKKPFKAYNISGGCEDFNYASPQQSQSWQTLQKKKLYQRLLVQLFFVSRETLRFL
jgi:hypothetical protein